MKNIFEIAKEFGLEIPEDKKKDFEKAVLENYKTVADYEKQTDKVTNLTEQLKTATAAFLCRVRRMAPKEVYRRKAYTQKVEKAQLPKDAPRHKFFIH